MERRDSWKKTLITVKVLTTLKKNQAVNAKRLEEEKKDKRNTIWRRLGFKLRILRLFTKKINNPSDERLIKLKQKLGEI